MDALPAVKRHATNFLVRLRPADQVTVLGFNDSIFMTARRATDQATRAAAIRRLGPWGGTALYDAIFGEIVEDLRHQYLLGYAAPDNARGGGLHRIRVDVPGRGLTVRARTSYRLTRNKSQ
jgi:hypothetical protein